MKDHTCKRYRILNFIGNSISVFDQAAGLPVGVSRRMRDF